MRSKRNQWESSSRPLWTWRRNRLWEKEGKNEKQGSERKSAKGEDLSAEEWQWTSHYSLVVNAEGRICQILESIRKHNRVIGAKPRYGNRSRWENVEKMVEMRKQKTTKKLRLTMECGHSFYCLTPRYSVLTTLLFAQLKNVTRLQYGLRNTREHQRRFERNSHLLWPGVLGNIANNLWQHMEQWWAQDRNYQWFIIDTSPCWINKLGRSIAVQNWCVHMG